MSILNLKLKDGQQYLKKKGIDAGMKRLGTSSRLSSLPPNNDELAAEGYNVEFTNSDMPWAVRNLMDNYSNRLQWVSNSLSSDDQTALNQIRGAANATAVETNNSSSFTSEQKSELLTTFYAAEGMTYAAYQHALNNQNYWNSLISNSGENVKSARVAKTMFFKKLFRAVVRIVVAIAVTAAIVATVVATGGLAAAVIAGKSIAIAKVAIGASIKTALVKGVTLGSVKASAAIGTGFAAGIKNAEKNWNKDWQGINEFVFGFKIKNQ